MDDVPAIGSLRCFGTHVIKITGLARKSRSSRYASFEFTSLAQLHHRSFLLHTSSPSCTLLLGSTPSRTVPVPLARFCSLSRITGMLIAIPYASVLLVASFSCVWATPIAFNRDKIQRPYLESRTTEIGSLDSRGLAFNGLSARGDVHTIHRRTNGAEGAKAVTSLAFYSRERPTDKEKPLSVKDQFEVVRQAELLLKKAFPNIGKIPHDFVSMDRGTGTQDAGIYLETEEYSIVSFGVELDKTTKYQGVLVNPLKRPQKNGIITDSHGIVYDSKGSRIYPASSNSLMPGGKLVQLNPEYKPMYTGHWITDFTFTKKVTLDQATAGINAEKITRLAQTLLAYALPRVEVFGITGSLYNQPSDAKETTSGKEVAFTFRLKELTSRGRKNTLYSVVLSDPLGSKVEEGTVPDGFVYRGVRLGRDKIFPIAEGGKAGTSNAKPPKAGAVKP
ncbi:hypothetical protein BDP27DRAFT_1424429 [Rhodocollybia butyracea]|uniref:Uncharacterized protein n=1 Tax=Rhodocollybia butyracea TaxID=206335 RepID=A0A9P5U4C4_9AGAR|nr:hypothetical protein BDP27DRAFT_1424429 [Rhodocollybia butyracea]